MTLTIENWSKYVLSFLSLKCNNIIWFHLTIYLEIDVQIKDMVAK